MFLGFDRHLAEFLAQGGCDVELVRLADHGVHGNGHMMVIERNHAEALRVLTDWAERKLARRESAAVRARATVRAVCILATGLFDPQSMLRAAHSCPGSLFGGCQHPGAAAGFQTIAGRHASPDRPITRLERAHHDLVNASVDDATVAGIGAKF